MSTAAITIEQNGVKGAASKSRDDLVVGQPVKLRNANDDGVTSWRWKLTLPKGSSAALSNVVAAAPEFTPDVEGTYVIELSVDAGGTGQTDKRLAAVRLPSIVTPYGSISPRFLGVGEGDESNWIADFGGSVGSKVNDAGWWEDLDRWLRVLATVASTPSASPTEAVTDPSLVEAANAITLALGQRVIADPGSSLTELTVNLPAMGPSEALGGRRCSVILPLGNPDRDVVLAPDTGDGIIDSASGSVVTSLSLPSGTFGSYTVLDFEAVPGGAPPLPATIIPPIVPDNEPGFLPNFAPIPLTINGTGGTLPPVFFLGVDLVLDGVFIALIVNSANQPGGPGTAWTIQADIPGGDLAPFPALYDLLIRDATGAPTILDFARLNGAFGANVAANPTQPPTDVWVAESGGSGGGGGRWDEVLAAGPNTNGANAYVTLEDEIVWSIAPSPLVDPTVPPVGSGGPGPQPSPNFHHKASRSGVIPAAGGFVSLGSAIHEFTGFTASGFGNTIWLRWVGQWKRNSVTGIVRFAVLEEIWAYEFGTWSRLETIVASVHSNRFQFAGIGSEIFIQAADDPTFDYAARGVVEWSWIDGYPPS